MEQVVFVPASVYNKENNKSLKTQAVKKQEIPNYQTEQNPTYQNDWLKKELKKKLFAKADFFDDKNLFCPRIKLSSLQTLFLIGFETRILLSNFPQQVSLKKTQTFQTFTFLDAAGISPTLIVDQNAQAKKRGSRFF